MLFTESGEETNFSNAGYIITDKKGKLRVEVLNDIERIRSFSRIVHSPQDVFKNTILPKAIKVFLGNKERYQFFQTSKKREQKKKNMT